MELKMNKSKKLIRQQLEARLNKFRPLLSISIPHRGWIRAIRDALGMSGRQLADRVGITKQWMSSIEKQELTGAATLTTMRRIGESMDCIFIYCFVPRTSLEQTVRDQATKVAVRRLSQASQTMSLEEQALSKQENKKVLSDMIGKLVDELPSNLWN